MDEQPFLLRNDRADGLTSLTLNRPNQFNALSGDMLGALQSALDVIAGDPAVRVVVIAGAGKAFAPDTTSRKCVPITTRHSCRPCSNNAAR